LCEQNLCSVPEWLDLQNNSGFPLGLMKGPSNPTGMKK